MIQGEYQITAVAKWWQKSGGGKFERELIINFRKKATAYLHSIRNITILLAVKEHFVGLNFLFGCFGFFCLAFYETGDKHELLGTVIWAFTV